MACYLRILFLFFFIQNKPGLHIVSTCNFALLGIDIAAWFKWSLNLSATCGQTGVNRVGETYGLPFLGRCHSNEVLSSGIYSSKLKTFRSLFRDSSSDRIFNQLSIQCSSTRNVRLQWRNSVIIHNKTVHYALTRVRHNMKTRKSAISHDYHHSIYKHTIHDTYILTITSHTNTKLILYTLSIALFIDHPPLLQQTHNNQACSRYPSHHPWKHSNHTICLYY